MYTMELTFEGHISDIWENKNPLSVKNQAKLIETFSNESLLGYFLTHV